PFSTLFPYTTLFRSLHQRGSNFLSKPRLQTRRLFSAVPRRLRRSCRLLRRALFVFFILRHFLITLLSRFRIGYRFALSYSREIPDRKSTRLNSSHRT